MRRVEKNVTIRAMNACRDFYNSPTQQQLLDEYRSFESDEDRLEWLMERSPLHERIPESLRSPARRVPGCLSGLWLHATYRQGRCFFSSHSDSAMVQGISSFLCDLHSNRPPEQIVELNHQVAKELGLERLLSMNRKRAVSSVMNYIVSEAREHLGYLALPITSETV